MGSGLWGANFYIYHSGPHVSYNLLILVDLPLAKRVTLFNYCARVGFYFCRSTVSSFFLSSQRNYQHPYHNSLAIVGQYVYLSLT
jgi:hypothetical protein